MAATFGPITLTRESFVAGKYSLYKPPHSISLSPNFRKYPLPNFSIYHRPQVPAMAEQDPQVNGFEIAEPSPKVQKLERGGGVNGFLRAKKLSEKAVLPFRASPFAAGYDLCR